jgi:hypothetical protein
MIATLAFLAGMFFTLIVAHTRMTFKKKAALVALAGAVVGVIIFLS